MPNDDPPRQDSLHPVPLKENRESSAGGLWLWLFLVCPTVALVAGLLDMKFGTRDALGDSLGFIVLIYGSFSSVLVGFGGAVGGTVLSFAVPQRLLRGWARSVSSAAGVGLGATTAYYAIFSSAEYQFHSTFVLLMIGSLGFLVGLIVNALVRAAGQIASRRRLKSGAVEPL
jgi:hypothetical protein